MRKTGTRLLAVLAAVSMTVSLLPVNAVTAAQTDKAPERTGSNNSTDRW